MLSEEGRCVSLPEKVGPGLGEPADPPHEAALQGFQFQVEALFPHKSHENMIVLPGKPGMAGHDLAHCLRGAPADAA